MEAQEKLTRLVKELISSNQTEKAIEVLSKEQLSSLDKELILLNSRYNKLKEEIRFGTIDNNSARLEMNKINLAILDLAEKINAKGGKSASSGTLKTSNTNISVYLFSIAGVLLIGSIAFWLLTKTNKAPDDPLKEEKETIAADPKANKLQADSAAYEKAVAQNTIAALETYINQFSDGVFLKDATDKLNAKKAEADNLAWQEASKKNTIEAYQDYLNNYVAGIHKADAIKKQGELQRNLDNQERDKAAWDNALLQNTIQSYQTYLRDYPGGSFRDDANNKINEIKRNQLKAENSSREIVVSLIKLVCENSDDEGPGNDADMAEFRFSASAWQKNCQPKEKENSSGKKTIYDYNGAQVEVEKNDSWDLPGRSERSARFAFDNQHCNTFQLKIEGYAREADVTSEDETDSNSIDLDLTNDSNVNRTVEFRLKSSDFTYYCQFRIEKAGVWKFGEKF